MKRKIAAIFVALCSALITIGLASCDGPAITPPTSNIEDINSYEIEIDTTDFNSIVPYKGTFDYQGLNLIYRAYIGGNSLYETKIAVKPDMVKGGLDTTTVGEKDLVIEYGSEEFIVPYTVKYQVDFLSRGEVFNTQFVLSPEEVVSPTAPEVEGHTFGYWESEIPEVLEDNLAIEAHYYKDELHAPALQTFDCVYDRNATLADLDLPANENGHWEFVEDVTTPIGNAGSHKFEVRFLPSMNEIAPVDNEFVQVNVAKRAIAAPTVSAELTYAAVLQKATVTDVETGYLPYVIVNEGGVDAGEYIVTVTLEDTDNYEWKDADAWTNENGVLRYSYEIEPKKVTFVVDSESFVYDGNEHYPTYTFADPEDVPNVSVMSGKPQTEAGSGYKYGWLVIDDNYTGMYTGTFEITKLDVTVTAVLSQTTIVYPAAIPEITFQVEGFAGDVELLNITVEKPSSANVGTYEFTPIVGNSNVNATCVSATLTVEKGEPEDQSPTLSTEGIGGTAAIYGDAISTVTFSDEGFGKWAWVNPDQCIDSMGTFSAEAIFTPQNPNLKQLKKTLTITNIAKRTLNIVVTKNEYTYTGGEFALEYKIVDERFPESYVVESDKITAVNGNDTAINAGTHSRTLEIVSDYYKGVVNSELTIRKATPVVTLSSTAATLKFVPGMTLAECGVTPEGTAVRPNDNADVVGTYAWKVPTFGLYDLTIDEATPVEVLFTPDDTDNYNSVITSFNFTIIKADTVIQKLEGSSNKVDLAEEYTKVFDNKAYEFIATVNRAVVGDYPNYTYVYKDSNGTVVDEVVNAGTYTLTIIASETTHYNGAEATVNVTVTQAANRWGTVSTEQPPYITSSEWVYKGTAGEIKADALWGIGTLTITYENTTTGTVYENELPIDAQAGSYVATLRIPEIANWAGLEATVNFTIKKAGVERPNLAFTETLYTGSVQKPTVGECVVEFTYVYENENSTDKGTYKITLTLVDGINYVWNGTTNNCVDVSYSIMTATNVITTSDVEWTYGEDRTDPTWTAAFGTITYTYYTDEDCTAGNAISLEDLKNASVGTYYVKAFVPAAENDNYTSATATKSFRIVEAELTGIPFTKTYEITWFDGLTLAAIGLDDHYTWDALTTELIAGTTANYPATYKIDNYQAVHGTFVVTVNKITSNVTANDRTFTYGEKTFTLDENSANSALNEYLGVGTNRVGDVNVISYAISYQANETAESEAVTTIANAGVYTVTVNLAESEHYTSATTTVIVTVYKVVNTQTIPSMSAIYGDTLSLAKDNNGKTLSDYNDTYGEWTWEVGNDTLVGNVGSYTLTAKYTPNAEYAVNYAERTVTVSVTVKTKAIKAPTLSNTNLVYTGSELKATVTDVELAGNRPYTIENVGGTNAGEYNTITVTLHSDNYAWTEIDGWTHDGIKLTAKFEIAKAPNSVTISLDNWTYAQTASELVVTATYEGNLNEKKLYVNDVESVSLPKNAGTYTLYVVIPESDNYLAGTSNTITFTIDKADIASVADAYVDTEQEATYGDKLSNLTLPTTELGRWSWKNGANTSVGVAGTRTFVAQFIPNTTGVGANYNAKDVDVTVTVKPATATATLGATEFDYNGSVIEVSVTVTATVNGAVVTLTEGTDYTVSGRATDAGEHTITIAFKTGNYILSEDQVALTYMINQVENAWASGAPSIAASWTYGETAPALTLPALKFSDKDTVTTVTYTHKTLAGVSYTNSIPNDAPAGAYSVTISVTGNDNWAAMTDTTLSFEILKAERDLPTFEFDSIPYNKEVQKPTVNDTYGNGSVGGVDYTVEYSAESKNYGTYTVTVTLNSTNHVWADTDSNVYTHTYYITTAPNAITTSDIEWTYGEDHTNPTWTATFGTITYTYYTDAACTNGITLEALKTAHVGTYYVKAYVSAAENQNYTEATALKSFRIINANADVTFGTTYTVTEWSRGMSLSAIALNPGYTWNAPNTVLEPGTTTEYAATYDVENYEVVSGTFIVVVEKVAGSVSVGIAENDREFVYGDQEFTLSEGKSAALDTFLSLSTNHNAHGFSDANDFSYAISYKKTETAEGVSVNTIKNAGIYEITVKLAASTHYKAAEANVTITVTKQGTGITFITAFEATYEDTLGQYVDKLPERNELGYWKWADGNEVSVGTVAGTAGENGYNLHSAVFVPDDPDNYNADKIDVRIKVAAKALDAPTITPGTLTYQPGVTQKAKIEVTGDARYTLTNNGGINAGSYTATVGLKDKANYVWNYQRTAWTHSNGVLTYSYTIEKANNSWTTEPTVTAQYAYTGSAPAYNAVSFVNNEKLSVTFSTETFAVGTHTVTFNVPATDNYQVLTKTLTFTVIKATVELPAFAPTAIYGDLLSSIALPHSDFGTWSWSAAAGTTVGNVGNNEFTATFAPTDTHNYNENTATVTVKVNPATATASLDENSFDYNGSVINVPVTVTATVNGETVTLAEGTDYTVSGRETNADSHTITIAFTTGNYALAKDQATLTYTINQVENTWASGEPTISAANNTWTHGDTTPTFTIPALKFKTDVAGNAVSMIVTINGMEDQTISANGGSVTLPTAAGEYTAKINVVGNDNWTWTEQRVNFTIEEKPIALPTVQADFTYNGTEQKPIIATSADYSVTAWSNENSTSVGSYTVKLTLTNSNYAWSGTATNVTIDGNVATFTYNINTAQAEDIKLSAVSITGWTYGDTLTSENSPSATAESFVTVQYRYERKIDGVWTATTTVVNAGDYRVQAYVVADGNNYVGVESAWKEFTVAKKTVSGIAKLTDFVYNGIGVTPIEGEGFTMTFTKDGELVSEAKNAGVYTVIVTAEDNYVLDSSIDDNYTFEITPATVKVQVAEGSETTTYNGNSYSATIEFIAVPNGGKIPTSGEYTVNGNEGTNAGTYNFTVTLKNNYILEDGTRTQSLSFKIQPKQWTEQELNNAGVLADTQKFSVDWYPGLTLAAVNIGLTEYAWRDSTTALTPSGKTAYPVVYTHSSGNYKPYTLNDWATVTVNRAQVTITTTLKGEAPAYDATKAYTVTDLMNVAISVKNATLTAEDFTWTWSNGSTTITDAGTYSISAKWIGVDDSYYRMNMSNAVSATINKAYAPGPGTISASVGDTLSELTSQLPTYTYGAWAFKTPTDTLTTTGDHNVAIVFTPYQGYENNYAAYETTAHISVGQTVVNTTITATSETFINGDITVSISVQAGEELLTVGAGKDYTYTVTHNGTPLETNNAASFTIRDAGTYTFTLTFTIAGGYSWNTADGTVNGITLTKTLVIGKATNTWNVEPAISVAAITYGTSYEATATAKYGTVAITYATKAADGTWSDYGTTKPTNAGMYKVKFFVEDTDNYTELSKEIEYTIAKATPVISIKNTYDLTWYEGLKLGDIRIENATATPAGGTFAWATPDTALNATTYENILIVYTPTDTANYNTATAKVTVNVAPKEIQAPTVSADLTYTGSTQTATVTDVEAEGNRPYTVVNNGGKNVGNYTATVTLHANYAWTNVSGWTQTGNVLTYTYTIAKATNVVTVSMEDWTFGENAKAPVTTTVFGSVVITYAAVGSEEYSETKPVDAGTYKVKATVVADGDNYDEAFAEDTFTIAQATNGWTNGKRPTISGGVYNGNAYAANTEGCKALFGTFTTTYYKVEGDVETKLDGAPSDAGSYRVRFVGDVNANYTQLNDYLDFTITPKAITPTLSGTNNLVYNKDAQIVTASTEEGVTEFTVSCANATVNGTSISVTNAGEYTVIFTLTSDNYVWKDNENTVSFAVARKQITANDVAAIANATKVSTYDGTNKLPALTGYEGFETEITKAEAFAGTIIHQGIDAGNYTLTLALTDATNYEFANGLALTYDFTINRAEATATITTKSATYNGGTHSQTISVTSGSLTVKYKVNGGEDVSGDYEVTETNAGTHTYAITLVDTTNFVLTAGSELTFTINKAKVTASISNSNRVYTGADLSETITVQAENGITVKYTVMLGDSVVVADTTSATTMVTQTRAGTYHYTVVLADTDNFELVSTAPLTFTIAKSKLQASVKDGYASFTFNNTERTAEYEVTSANNGATVGYKMTDGNTNKATSVGNYKFKLELTDTANYEWVGTTESSVELSFEIEQADNTWSVDPAIDVGNKFEYGTDYEATATATYGNDTLKVTYATKLVGGTWSDYSTTKPTNAGTYKVKFYVAETTDYTGLSAEITYTIVSRKVEKPAISDTTKTYVAGRDSILPDYTSTLAYTVAWTANEWTLEETRVNGVDVGTYTITISLNNEDGIINYEWADGSLNTLTATYTINSAELNVTCDLAQDAVYGTKLNSLSLPTTTVGTWAWADGADTLVGDVGNHSFTAVCTLTGKDVVNYVQPADQTIAVTVSASSNYTVTGTTSVSVDWSNGLTLSKVNKPTFTATSGIDSTMIEGKYEWVSGTMALTDCKEYSAKIHFKPNSANYAEKDINVTVTVNKVKVNVSSLDRTHSVDYKDAAYTLADLDIEQDSRLTYTWNKEPINAGDYTLTIALADSDHYELYDGEEEVASIVVNVTINKSNPSVTIQTTYNEVWREGLTLNSLKPTDTAEGTFAWQNATVGLDEVLNVGTYTLQIVYTPTNENYNEITKDITVTVTEKAIDVPSLSDSTLTYTGTAQHPTVTESTYYDVAYVDSIYVGSYDVTLTLTNPNCKWNDDLGESNERMLSYTIEKATDNAWTGISIDGATKSGDSYTATYSGSAYEVTATAKYGTVAITYYQGETQLTAAPVNAGTYTIKLSVAGTENYNAIAETTITLTIKKAEVNSTIINTLNTATKIADYTGEARFTDVLNALQSGEGFTYAINGETGVTEIIKAGEYKITLSVDDSDNHEWDGDYDYPTDGYTFTVNRVTVTAKIKDNDAYAVDYNGTEQSGDITVTATGFTISYKVEGVTSGYVSGATTVKATDADTYTYTITLQDTTNFKFANGTASTTVSFTINSITLTVSGVTFTDNTWTYGQYDATANAYSATVTPTLANVNVQYKFASAANDAIIADFDPNTASAGTYRVKAYVEANGDNYAYAESTNWTSFTIEKATVTEPTNQSYDYDGNDHIPAATADYTVTVTKGGETVTEIINAGEYTVTFTLKDSNNYTWSTSSNASIECTYTITAATATLEVPTTSFEYTGSPILVEVVVKAGDTVLTKDRDYTVSGYATNVGNYTLTVTLTNTNYTFASGATATQSYTITQKKVAYDGQTMFTVPYGTTFASMALPTSTYGRWAWQNTGTVGNASETPYEYTVKFTPNDTDNYAVVTQTVKVTVTKIDNTVTLTVADKTYDGNPATGTLTAAYATGATYTYSGTKKDGTTVSGEGFPTDAGTYTVTVTIAESTNYNVATATSNEFTISKADNAITGNILRWSNGNSWIYGESATTTLVLPELKQAFGIKSITYKKDGETTTNTDTSLAGVGVGSYTIISVLVNGDNNWNELTITESLAFTVTKRSIVVPTLSQGSFVYNGSVQKPTVAESDYYEIAYVNSVNVGTYNVTLTLKSTDNCQWADGTEGAVKTLSYDITKATITSGFTASITGATLSGSKYSIVYGTAYEVVLNKPASYIEVEVLYNGEKLATAPTNVGEYVITFRVIPSDNYEVTCELPGVTLVITPAELTSLTTEIDYTTATNGYYYQNELTETMLKDITVCTAKGVLLASGENETVTGTLTDIKNLTFNGDSSTFDATFTPNSANYNAKAVSVTIKLKSVAYIGSTYYGTIEAALDAATSGQTVYVVPDVPTNNVYNATGNVIIKNTCTIGTNVTLCLPYSGTTYFDNYSATSSLGFADASTTSVTNNRKSLVTLDANTTLTVNGTLIIGGMLGSAGQGLSGHTSGSYAELRMVGNAKIISTGTINCYGYIKEVQKNGDTYQYVKDGASTILATSGEVYAPFVVYDYGGGTHTVGSHSMSNKDYAPFNIYDMPNIQSELTICQNVSLKGYADLYANSEHNFTTITVIAKSSAVINLSTTNSKAILKYLPDEPGYTKHYDSNPNTEDGITSIRLIGDASLGSMTMKVTVPVFGTQTISTSGALFPISWKQQVALEEGIFTVGAKLKLLSGSKVTVVEGAILNVTSSMIVYPKSVTSNDTADTFMSNRSIGYNYPEKPEAELIVCGTANISAAFGGIVKAGSSNAILNVTSSTLTVTSYEYEGTSKGMSRETRDTVTRTFQAPGYNAIYSTAGTYNVVQCGGQYVWVTDTAKLPFSNFQFSIVENGSFTDLDLTLTQDIMYNSATTLAGATYTGSDGSAYKFLGWYNAANTTDAANKVEAITYKEYVDRTLYGVFEKAADTITVTFVAQAPSANYGITGFTDDQLTVTIDPGQNLLDLASDYRFYTTQYNKDYQKYFSHWYQEGSADVKVETLAEIYAQGTKEITLYAKWLDKLEIKANLTAGSTNSPIVKVTVDSNDTVELKTTGSGQHVAWVKPGQKFSVEYSQTSSNSISPAYDSTKGATDNYTISATGENNNDSGGGCVTSETLVTLADGTKVEIQNLTGNEELLVFDHETGKYTTSFILFIENDGVKDYEILNVEFSDGTKVRIIYEHALFDKTLNKYVYINDDTLTDYIGHEFIKGDGSTLETVVMTKAYKTVETTGCYSLVTAYQLNHFIEGMLSIPGGIDGLFNFFDYDENLKYDETAKANDIAEYGLLSYEALADYGVTEEMFEVFNGKYLAVAIGKGNLTMEDIIAMAERYGVHFESDSEQVG